MKQYKEKPITVTHTEILAYAIQDVSRKFEEVKERAEAVKENNPQLAKMLMESCPWKGKLKVLLQLYKIETGTDYGYDFEDELD